MAKTVINLISSSPPPAVAPAAARYPRNSLLDGIELLSDDLDVIASPSDAILTESNGNKRRRVSRSPSLKPVNNTPNIAASTHSAIDLSFDDKDPFLTSSPRPPTQGRATSLPPDLSDPFASSPLPVYHKAKSPIRKESTRLGRTKHGEAEAISSPTAANKPAITSRQQWDPISSSAPDATSANCEEATRRPSRANVISIDSDSDSDELPDIRSLASKPLIPRTRSPIRRARSDVLPKPARKPKDKAQAEAEKERKRREKQAAKDAKALEKERAAALAEVNKMRDKKASAQEMIIELPSSLSAATRTQAETLCEGLFIQYATWESPEAVVKWRRKITSRFNDDLGLWEPIPRQVKLENHVAVVLTADEFVALALDDVGAHVDGLKQKYPGQHIIYLLEGLGPWIRKNRNARNRQFTSGVRSQEASSSATGRRRNAPIPEYISEDVVEDALLELQVMHEDVLIHHTAMPLETAQWLVVLTQHISTIPCKRQKDQASAGFCMESGQVKTGEDVQDTYVRILQEIARVTPPIAYGIAGEFKTVRELVEALERGGPLRLKSIRKTVNKEGDLSDRTVGQAVSRRIYKVFTGRDASSTDV